MTHSPDSRVTSSDKSFISDKQALRLDPGIVWGLENGVPKLEDKIDDIKPDRPEELKNCLKLIGRVDANSLANALKDYIREFSRRVKACYEESRKTKQASILKKCMYQGLVFFYMCSKTVREGLENTTYYSNMTKLVSMYLDLEICASSLRKTGLNKLTAKLKTVLYILLDGSEELILDALLQTNLMTRSFEEICSGLLSKILKEKLPEMTEVMYARYLLLFKMWKRLTRNKEEKHAINQLAAERLPLPINFTKESNFFAVIFPCIRETSINVTLFLMKKKFSCEEAYSRLQQFLRSDTNTERNCKLTSESDVRPVNLAEIKFPVIHEKFTKKPQRDQCCLFTEVWRDIEMENKQDSGKVDMVINANVVKPIKRKSSEEINDISKKKKNVKSHSILLEEKKIQNPPHGIVDDELYQGISFCRENDITLCDLLSSCGSNENGDQIILKDNTKVESGVNQVTSSCPCIPKDNSNGASKGMLLNDKVPIYPSLHPFNSSENISVNIFYVQQTKEFIFLDYVLGMLRLFNCIIFIIEVSTFLIFLMSCVCLSRIFVTSTVYLPSIHYEKLVISKDKEIVYEKYSLMFIMKNNIHKSLFSKISTSDVKYYIYGLVT